MESLLSLVCVGVSYGDRVVLQNLTLNVQGQGATLLLGPVASGKSTLLRSICDPGYGGSGVKRAGAWSYLGDPLGAGQLPALVEQKARLLLATVFDNLVEALPGRSALTQQGQRTVIADLLRRSGLAELSHSLDRSVLELSPGEQRMVAIVRCAASDPALLCVDEPTAGLPDDQAEAVVRLLRQEAHSRGVLVVTHNQRHARELGGTVVLLAGGTVQESGESQAFFESPQSEAGKVFVRTGSCALPSPATRQEDLAPEFRAGGQEKAPTEPTGFRWLEEGRLAGVAQPGLIREVEDDLNGLRGLGVTVLLTLTERKLNVSPDLLHEYGLRSIWLPIDDMHAPGHAAASSICKQLAELLRAGEAVAIHCRAGLGRTGTMLAAHLIFEHGLEGSEALARVRRVQPLWVQSQVQERFLNSFAVMLNG